jgi:hypothetical protein
MKYRKTAVCISGQIRTALESIKSFNSFFEHEDIDVFIHTWYLPGVDDHTEIIEQINTLYKPKKFVIEKSKHHERLNFETMLKTIFLSNELRKDYEIENDVKYDVVVRYRFDLIFPKHVKFPKSECMPRTIYYPISDQGIINTDYQTHGMTDVFFYGDDVTMNIATNIYKVYKFSLIPLRELYSKLVYFYYDISDSLLSPGQLIYKHCVTHNIQPVLKRSDNGSFLEHTLFRDDIKHLDCFENFNDIAHYYVNAFREDDNFKDKVN